MHGLLPVSAATVQKIPALLIAAMRLVALGHRRIVIISREERRKPQPGLYEQAFLDELGRQGIPTGRNNLPDWGNFRDGFHQYLDSLFKHTPPTALIFCEPSLFAAVHDHLARRGITAPERISLICDDPDPHFAWFKPAITHFRWDPAPLMLSIVRWANQAGRGKRSIRKTYSVAEFIEGGTIGPVRE